MARAKEETKKGPTMADVSNLVVKIVTEHPIPGMRGAPEDGKSGIGTGLYFTWERGFKTQAGLDVGPTSFTVLPGDKTLAEARYRVMINAPACARTVAEMVAQQALTDEVVRLAALIEASILELGPVIIEP